MSPGTPAHPALVPPRPVEETYWVVPGRLLVGAHPGSRSRANAMDRLRRFLECGVTCFVDLTEPEETTAYEALLPFETPTGRRVEYLREPIRDHGVPSSRETMSRILAMLDGALDSGHLVYLHCRAGVGRSAMAAACWLAERTGGGEQGLAELARVWPQAAQSKHWPTVPETPEQEQFVRDWPVQRRSMGATLGVTVRPGSGAGPVSLRQRVLGGWLGLALGDALGAAKVRGAAPAPRLEWTQPTALALCSVDSLLDLGRFDARDQIERFLRWQKDGYRSASGAPGTPSADVAKALATYQWRGLPMAGSHDPADQSATSLSRALAAVTFAGADATRAIALAAECSRTTHQSPVILDACRLYGAMLESALRGEPASQWAEVQPACATEAFAGRPLHKELRPLLDPGLATSANRTGVLHVLHDVRQILASNVGFDEAVARARQVGKREPALYASLVGALVGLRDGVDALPRAERERLAGAEEITATAERCLSALQATPGVGEG